MANRRHALCKYPEYMASCHQMSLKTFLGHHGAHRISERDIVRWKDRLLSRGLSPKTINDNYLSSVKTVFDEIVRDRLLAKSPIADMRMPVRRRAGEGMLPYTDEEVRPPSRNFASCETDPTHRWLPLLAATSGARIGEADSNYGETRSSRLSQIVAIHLRPRRKRRLAQEPSQANALCLCIPL